MWRWILGALGVIVALVATCTWYAYNKIQSFANGDSTTVVTIAATPAQVYASLATGDSLQAWMAPGRTGMVKTSSRGMLKAGDTIYVERRDTAGGNQRMNWIITEAAAPSVLAMTIQGDTTGIMTLNRKYTLVAKGDSTELTSLVTAPTDSQAIAKAGGGSSAASSMIGFSTKLLAAGVRMQSKYELEQLKERVEGKGMAASSAAAEAPAAPDKPTKASSAKKAP